MYYIGIDQSLNNVGVCILNTKADVIDLMTVKPKLLDDKDEIDRLIFIRNSIYELIKLYKTIQFTIEGYAYDKDYQAHQLGEIGGVLRVLFREQQQPFLVVSPVSLKKFATGNYKASKQEMMDKAKEEGLDIKDDHQADAYFLAKVAYLFKNENSAKTRSALEVIQQLKNPPEKCQKKRARKVVKNSL